MKLVRILPAVLLLLAAGGVAAQGFVFKDMQGQAQRLPDYRGKWVLVNFWATWCPPCLEEIPDLNALHEAHRKTDLVVIGVALDPPGSRWGAALAEEIRRAGGRVDFVASDVSQPGTNERLVETCRRSFGGIDVAVCCAGMLGLGSATDVPLETWRQTLAVNLDAVFYLMRFALPDMQRRGGGSFVVVSSVAAQKGFPNHAAYCASKGALVALVRQVAIDYGPRVRVNALCPGPTDTPLIWASAVAFPDPAKAVEDCIRRGAMTADGMWTYHPWGQFVLAGLSIGLLGQTTLAARP